jgi:hypothetical protein
MIGECEIVQNVRVHIHAYFVHLNCTLPCGTLRHCHPLLSRDILIFDLGGTHVSCCSAITGDHGIPDICHLFPLRYRAVHGCHTFPGKKGSDPGSTHLIRFSTCAYRLAHGAGYGGGVRPAAAAAACLPQLGTQFIDSSSPVLSFFLSDAHSLPPSTSARGEGVV